MPEQINYPQSTPSDPLAFFKYFYDHQQAYELRGFTVFHEDFHNNNPEQIYGFMGSIDYDAKTETFTFNVEEGVTEDGAYSYTRVFVDQLKYKLTSEYWNAIECIDKRMSRYTFWNERISFLEDIILRLKYLKSRLSNDIYEEASKYKENKAILTRIQQAIYEKYLLYMPNDIIQKDSVLDIVKKHFDNSSTEKQNTIPTTKSIHLKKALTDYSFFTFLTSKGYDDKRQYIFFSQLLDNDVPYCIAFISEIGYLSFFVKEYGLTANERDNILATIFGVTPRRIKGNINVLNPFTKEKKDIYTSIQHIDTIRKEIKGL